MTDPQLLARIRRVWSTLSPREQAAIRQWIGNQRPPPDPGDGFAPEQFWEHCAYMDAIGNLLMRDCTFGPDWATKPNTLYSTWDDFSGDWSNSSTTQTEWGCWGTYGLAHAVLNMYGPIQKNISFTDCAWLAKDNPETGAPSTMRWGIRAFALMDAVFDRCSFSRGMGAGTQVALRANAAGGDITPQGVHRYENCTYTGIGDPKSERWGAFTISEHAPEGYDFQVADIAVEIVGCTIKGGHINWVDGNGKLVQSARGIMANGRNQVSIQGLTLDAPNPYSNWAVQLWNDNDVTLADSDIKYGLVEVKNAQKIDITGNKGGAILRVRNAQNHVIHDGPLAEGFQLG